MHFVGRIPAQCLPDITQTMVIGRMYARLRLGADRSDRKGIK